MPKAITVTVMLPDEIAAKYEPASDVMRHVRKDEECFNGDKVMKWAWDNSSKNIYLILRKIPKPEWPASLAGTKIPWICGSQTGNWLATEAEPIEDVNGWRYGSGETRYLPRVFYPDLPPANKSNWRTMKIANPNMER